MRKNYIKGLLAAALITVGSSAVYADENTDAGAATAGRGEPGTNSADMNVIANVNSACGLTTSTLNFGVYTANQATDLDKAGELNLYCSRGTSYTIGINAGLNTDKPTDYATRYMHSIGGDSSNSSYLMYSLYLDQAHTKVWDDQSNVLSGTFQSVNQQNLPIYGRVFKGQDIVSGPYQDTVKIILQYS